jgi:hypothetical protein
MIRLSRWTAVVATLILTVLGAPAAVADDSPPFTSFIAPTDGMYAEVGEPVLITGAGLTPEGHPATKVELTFDDGASWVDVDWPTWPWRYVITPGQPGDITFRARAWVYDTLGETSPPRTLHVGTSGPLAPVNCTPGCSLGTVTSPLPHDDSDAQPVELGVRFAVDRPERLTRVSFKRGTYVGPLTIRVWGPDGTLLREQVEPYSAPGTDLFPAINPPVLLQPNVDYVVSYYTPEGGYQVNEDYYIGTLLHAPFIARADAGVYHYGQGGGFPTDTWGHSNYTIYPYVTT